jgi:hypothetical protein
LGRGELSSHLPSKLDGEGQLNLDEEEDSTIGEETFVARAAYVPLLLGSDELGWRRFPAFFLFLSEDL